ncbi:hypothetical protein PMIN02_008262 [Paraphaeosphaeria minitans]|uniref:AAA domain-containing protein n=1 Tax=Paraphaeosphaeria minitans TaxID=565426 RepID=A0A9P6KM11_9PLEO|nr:AAA domain-containing protein [Paraphaeosphaeria minitans]
MRASSTQKAYDEAFLACSTAVYFEAQSNEAEALRSWRTALDQITYHNAHRGPSLVRPASSTEQALVESLRQLELQCKERVDLLEALKRSRQESAETLTSPRTDAKAPTPPPHGAGTLPVQADPNGASSWLGGGTIPPVDYNDLSRPPPLPKRPSLAPRRSSGTASTRTLTETASKSSLAAPATTRPRDSRTPSPEKKGRMLRTLRPGRESKSSSSSRLPTSLRSQPPDAAKAATQAWGFNTNSRKLAKTSGAAPYVSSSRPSLEIPSSSLDTTTPSLSAYDNDTNQPQPSPYSRSTETSVSPAYNPPPAHNRSDPEQALNLPRLPRKTVPSSSDPRYSFDTSRSRSFQASAPVPVMPSYRNEYPEPTLSNHALAASAAAKLSWPDSSTKFAPPNTRPSQQLGRDNNTDSRARRPRKDTPEPIAVETDDNETKTRPPPRRKGKAKANTVRADLPPTPSSEVGDCDGQESDSDEWKEKCRTIMKSLPRGVDEAAAKQILNEIVIHGDEVHWSDVAGLDIAKSALKETVVYPFLRPDLFMGLREPARGMLLFGPPGTGKTMLARAVATESHSTFFAISASSLTSKFLGESEKLVRALFALAKMLAPSIIFIDEIDSLLSSRSGSGEHEATRRIKTEFLIQWSDLAKAAAGKEQTDKDKERGDATRVLVLAATNLPWAIDEAARRRFVRRQYIPLPEGHVRKSQVQTLMSHQKHELSGADLDRLIQLTYGFSGSDITALAKDAAMGPLRSLGEKLLHMTMDEIRPIRFEDFQASLQTIRPSVSRQGLKEYEDWAREFGERGG